MQELFQLLSDHFPASANRDKYPEATYKSAGLLATQFNQLITHCASYQMSHRRVGEFDNEDAAQLLEILEANGSDKGNRHHYHRVYSYIFRNIGITSAIRLLEIGIGTNNPVLISTMGSKGTPGASLRAFRDFLPNAQVFGADIDRNILFQEQRIETGFIDQLDADSFNNLEFGVDQFDVIIDDGLHSIGANFNTLLFALRAIKPGGWIVIEDIPAHSHPFWNSVDYIVNQGGQFETCMIKCRIAHLYVLKKKVSALP